MDVAGAAGLTFGVIGAVDVCLKYDKSVLETYKSYQHAHREISELILRINHQWFKISTNLEFLRTTFQDLKPGLQIHIGTIIRALKFKLQHASDGIAAVVNEKYKMQHDIYSLGVCLLEIGLWSSFVVRQKEGNVAGPELNVEEFLATKDIRKRAAEVKQTLVDMTDNGAFREEGELVDEDGILIGVRYIEVILQNCSLDYGWVVEEC
ncbi:hypothetical protein BDD12DRAFT_878289 [Trichophaea hybrida]|nr:hypothetical protein BDD12DRAFT_878289 [Trichophaea hybrida]